MEIDNLNFFTWNWTYEFSFNTVVASKDYNESAVNSIVT